MPAGRWRLIFAVVTSSHIPYPVGAPNPKASAARLRSRFGADPFEALLVLGSGLGALADAVADSVGVGFTELSGFPDPGVAGHAGRWIAGRFEGRRVLVQVGRYHVYEGRPLQLVQAPVRTAAALGTAVLVLTNAAGSLRANLSPGALVALTGHLDLMGGTLSDLKRCRGGAVRDPYDPDLLKLAALSAERAGVRLAKGVYAAVSGPSYETPAEVRMLEGLGADLVGMSTVPEATAARAAGVRCLALSVVTNWAAGISPTPPCHEEVLEVGQRSAAALERLLRKIVRALPPR